MPKMRKKADLPRKICATCGLPFTWRRKWARDWERVTHCSDRCRAARSRPRGPQDGQPSR
ncbi:DUF2256 domain-containing protein [Frigidibacter oleivorans]|uniref:DUF2256 domain-containing protein n=1 Tax=Frigidibacter oleivorans TaxID=2487129 RepID=UPI000F8CFEE0|nr:DUF2256 domain-containing protein [Frigidibacter oleivorans]